MPVLVKVAAILMFIIGGIVTFYAARMTLDSLISPVCVREFRIAIVSAPVFAFVISLWFANAIAVIRGQSASRIGLLIWVFISSSPLFIANMIGDPITFRIACPLVATCIPCAMLFLPSAHKWFSKCETTDLERHSR